MATSPPHRGQTERRDGRTDRTRPRPRAAPGPPTLAGGSRSAVPKDRREGRRRPPRLSGSPSPSHRTGGRPLPARDAAGGAQAAQPLRCGVAGHSPGNARPGNGQRPPRRPRGAARRPAPPPSCGNRCRRRHLPGLVASSRPYSVIIARGRRRQCRTPHRAGARRAGRKRGERARLHPGKCSQEGAAAGRGRRRTERQPDRGGEDGERGGAAGAGSDWLREASDVCAGFCSPLARVCACVGRLVAVDGR